MSKGTIIRVVRGRNVPLGTIGRVFWSGVGKYGRLRIGIDTREGERFFLAARNVVKA